MGKLIKSFTLGRNALKRTLGESADAVVASLEKIEAGIDLTALKRDDNGAYNIIRDLITYCGVIKRDGEKGSLTPLGVEFRSLCAQNKEDAWRWLITRTLWLYVVPNGTHASVNTIAKDLKVEFNFFRILLGLLVHLSALPGEDRVLSYHEMCALLDDDENWAADPADLFLALMALRKDPAVIHDKGRGLLGDLEDQYEIPRDNLNTCVNKAFQHTGLFEYRKNGARNVGIAIRSTLDSVLQRRIRGVIDLVPVWSEGDDWTEYLQLRKVDLPLEVSRNVESALEAEADNVEDLSSLLAEFGFALDSAGLRFSAPLILRFAAALLSKRFVILTGLAGSGKTKLAQAFARWITPSVTSKDPFFSGAEIRSARVTYYVRRSDGLSVEFWNGKDDEEATVVVLPRELINEWARYIEANDIPETMTARKIRESVKEGSRFSDQLHSFETHLKAAAFALIRASVDEDAERRYAVVPVGADWTGSENIIGYPDGIDPKRYVAKTALKLILRARERPDLPHFLILDEMNLSHVERYFADVLSAIESEEPIPLYAAAQSDGVEPSLRDGIPESVTLPKNLFVIGTVNVDETTYMFSPKVLDRANVIEFRVQPAEMTKFIADTRAVRMEKLDGVGKRFGPGFADTACSEIKKVGGDEGARFDSEMTLFYELLREHGAEYGFRVALEAARFVALCEMLGAKGVWASESGAEESQEGEGGTATDWLDHAVDAVVIQKFLPKLHGSKAKLGQLLRKLYTACVVSGEQPVSRGVDLAARWNDTHHAGELMEPKQGQVPGTRYSLSAEKLFRMWRHLNENGFTSFPEN